MAMPEIPEIPEIPADLESVAESLESVTDVADVTETLADVSDLSTDGIEGLAASGLDSAAKVITGSVGAAGLSAAAVTGAAADAIKKPKTGSNANKGPGRFTPKGSTPAKPSGKNATGAGEKLPAYASSGRYTAKSEKIAADEMALQTTRPWIPWLMFALLAIGGLLIVLNYVGVWPSAPSNWYLLGGIVAITGGFITATQLR
jgi:hypothetical protein